MSYTRAPTMPVLPTTNIQETEGLGMRPLEPLREQSHKQLKVLTCVPKKKEKIRTNSFVSPVLCIDHWEPDSGVAPEEKSQVIRIVTTY